MNEEKEKIEKEIKIEDKEEKTFSTSLILLGVVVFALIIIFSIFRFS